MPELDWTSAIVEPAHHGGGDQLSVSVSGADPQWAQRFNEFAQAHYQRGEVRGGRWGRVAFHESEGIITVDDLYGGVDGPIRAYLTDLTESASSD